MEIDLFPLNTKTASVKFSIKALLNINEFSYESCWIMWAMVGVIFLAGFKFLNICLYKVKKKYTWLHFGECVIEIDKVVLVHNINILIKLFLQQCSRGKLTHWHSCRKNTFIFCVSSFLIILPFFPPQKSLKNSHHQRFNIYPHNVQ